jgi:hypothetical protein
MGDLLQAEPAVPVPNMYLITDIMSETGRVVSLAMPPSHCMGVRPHRLVVLPKELIQSKELEHTELQTPFSISTSVLARD